jgi:hypothetical protein
MADLIAYTDLQTYLQAENSSVSFTAAQITVATNCCSAASDLVKQYTNRTFEIQGAAADRYFTAVMPYSSALGVLAAYYPWPGVFPFTALTSGLPAPILNVDDYFLTGQTLANITVTDKTTLTTYTPTYAYPYNADSKGLPYTGLVFAPGTALSTAEGQLKVNAKWGYVTSIPAGVKDLALIQASRFFKRPGAPFGVAGSTEMGTALRLLNRLDPDVEAGLTAYRRWWGAA